MLPLNLLLKTIKSIHGRCFIVIAILAFCLYRANQRLEELRLALAAKANVETQSETHSVEREERGRQTITREYAPSKTDACKPVIVREVIASDPIVIETEKNVEVEKIVERSCPELQPFPRWYIGAGYTPEYTDEKAWAGRAGITLNGRIDLGYRYSRLDRSHGIEAGIRF